jgi:hypothetical protein
LLGGWRNRADGLFLRGRLALLESLLAPPVAHLVCVLSIMLCGSALRRLYRRVLDWMLGRRGRAFVKLLLGGRALILPLLLPLLLSFAFLDRAAGRRNGLGENEFRFRSRGKGWRLN